MEPHCKNETEHVKRLRSRAEKRLTPVGHAELGKMSIVRIAHLLHELETHQIELELQNEELRSVQEELIAARDRYTELYDFAPVGYLTLDEKGLIDEANLRAADMLGAPLTSILHGRLSQFILPEDQDAFYLVKNRMKHLLQKRECELRLRSADGRSFWVRLQCIPEEKTATSAWRTSWTGRIRIVLIDIDRRKRAELELEQHCEQLRAFIEKRTGNREAEGSSDAILRDLRAPVRSINECSRTVLNAHADDLDEKGLQRLNRLISHTEEADERIQRLGDLLRLVEEALTGEDVKTAE